MNSDTLDRWSPYMLGLLRIVTALIFIEHGTQKLLGFPPGANPQPPLFSLFGFAGLLELVGGLLILLGLFTRPIAFILAGEMAFAYFMGHAFNPDTNPTGSLIPVVNRGELAVAYCFSYLYIAAKGSGIWSVAGSRAKS